MNGVCMCAVICFTSSFVSAQYIQIQALPLRVNYRENDLKIVCSITNPTQLKSVFYIQLLKNSSSTFDTVVSVFGGETSTIQWKDSNLQSRATATGNIDSPSTAQLRLTIDKKSVQCPSDFKMYMCKMSGLASALDTVTQETNPITVFFIVKPAVIEMHRVRILNENFDTPDRQFPVGTAVQLTCQGEVGSDASRTIRWCSQKANDNIFTGLPQTAIHSEASPSGCQYKRSSTITYNLTNEDTFTRFLCESGDTGMCGTGTAVQYVNITLETASAINSSTADDVPHPSSLVPVLSGSAVAIGVIILAIILTIILRRHFRQQQMKRSVYEENKSRDTTSYDNAEPYTEPGPTVDHLYTELNTISSDQQRRQGQFVATTDHPYSELNMTNTMNREGEEGQACPTGDHHYTELNTKNMVSTINIPRRTQ